MKEMKYLNRIADKTLDLRLEAFGRTDSWDPSGVARQLLQNVGREVLLRCRILTVGRDIWYAAQTKPSLLLKGATPRLIDEWQVAPVIWDAVRHAVDERREKGQFILTGSTVIDDEEIMHTGTGRITKMAMYPMSLFESLESNGSISLGRLFNEADYEIDGEISQLSIEQLIFLCLPWRVAASLDEMSTKAKLLIAKDYIDVICNEDISRVDKTRRNPALARLILRSYARNICTLAKKTSMLADVSEEMEGISMPTFDDYVCALEKLFVIDDIEAWPPAIRSKTVIRTGKKRCFVDPSIAVAALGASPESLELDLNTFGFIFECLCFRDLRAYSQALGGRLSYYHDRLGLEADAVLHLDDGRYALIECKLGSREIEDGAKHLIEIKHLITEKNMAEKQIKLREPDLLIVLTGGEMAYTREDGVKIIPIKA